MNVIIAGGREFNDYGSLCVAWNELIDSGKLFNVTIVSGTAKGADRLGERLAAEVHAKCIQMPADWEKYGKAAGYRRNTDMANISDILIACWDGKSRGTKHMIDIMVKQRKPVYIVKYI